MSKVFIQLQGMEAVEQTLDPNRLRRIRWSAMNEAARAGRTMFSRDIRRVLAAPAAIVNKALTVSRAVSDDGFAEIIVRRQPIELKHFKPRQNKVGVSVLVRNDQGRRTVRGAFGPKVDKLHGRVYRRKTQEPKPLQELYGQTAASVAAKSPGLLPRVTKRIAETLQARYASKMNYVLSQPRASAALGS